MKNGNSLSEYLKSYYKLDDEGIFYSEQKGYWSNLSMEENKLLINDLKNMSALEAIKKHQPWLEKVIFSHIREGGLELLNLSGNETCIDYGCMWGALTIPLAKRTGQVIGVDQTIDSLRFLNARRKDEKLSNISLLCEDIRKLPVLDENQKFDISIVNGVLEWVPEGGPIELNNYFGKYQKRNNIANPGKQQLDFLKIVYDNLKNEGKLYLAIENKFDFKMFLGVKDPHADLLFTSFLPRKIANYISQKKLGRPYVNWIYSFGEIKELLMKTGFSDADLFLCFPDYRFPASIIPYSEGLKGFRLTMSLRNSKGRITIKRILLRFIEFMIFKVFRLKALSPSIIAIAKK